MAQNIGFGGAPYQVGKRLAPLSAERSGAVTQDTPYLFDPTHNSNYRAAIAAGGFAAVQITSPINSAGAADLDIEIAGAHYFLAGGGNVQTIPGPVWAIKVTPRNASVGGTGTDTITFVPLGRL